MAATWAGVFHFACEARSAPREQTNHSQPGRGDGTAYTPLLQGPAERLCAAVHGRLYYALLDGRFVFDLVHEDDLDPANLKKYSAMVLPNTALLSDEQCR